MFAYRGRAVWIIAALGLLMLTPSFAAAAEEPCNGSPELCDRTLDQVVLPGTHNSMSAAELGWAIPNQTYSIPDQLKLGVRALLIDTHYGKPGAGGKGVVNWNSETDGDPRTNGAGTYLCHEYCQLGASDLTAELAKVAEYLAANPREVLTFVVQNGIDPEDYAKAVTDSGLIEFVYEGSTETYPTLSQMIDSNQRVLMLSEGGTGTVPWFHNGYAGPLQETPYDFRVNEAGQTLTTQGGIDLLTDPATLDSTCRPNRGGTTGKLFLMNHWVNGPLDNSNPVTPDPEVSKILNTRQVLVDRARACEARRGKLPDIVAVDLFGQGDLLGAVRELNGLAKPQLKVRKPRFAKVKAGKKAVFKLTISNSGDADAANVKVCAKVPSRLARKPRCAKVKSVPIDASRTVTLRVQTRKRFRKGSGTVRFSVYSSQPTIRKSARLTVKPLKKPKRHRKHHKR